MRRFSIGLPLLTSVIRREVGDERRAEPNEASIGRSSGRPALSTAPGAGCDLSTGCTECCGNVDYSTFANCEVFVSRPPCGPSRKAIHSLLRRARRGSRTKQHREVVRDGPQGPERKVDRGCGRNRDELGEFFFWSSPSRPQFPPRRGSRLIYDRRDAPAASSEHRPGSHRRPVGDRPCGVHLLRPDRGRNKCGDGDRARARVVRRDLVLRSATGRGRARATPPAPVEPSLTPPAGRPAQERARTTACARVRCRSRPRGAPARTGPRDRGCRGALKGGAPPVASESGRELSSRSVYRGTYPFSVIPPGRDPRPPHDRRGGRGWMRLLSESEPARGSASSHP